MYAAYRIRPSNLGADNELTRNCLDWLEKHAPPQLTKPDPHSSVTGPVNPAPLETARREINALITEVRNLTTSEISPQEFRKILVSNCEKALAAWNGRAWLRDGSNAWICHAAVYGDLPKSADDYRDATWIRMEADSSAQRIAGFGIGLRRRSNRNSVIHPTFPTSSSSENVEVLRTVARFSAHEGIGILELDQRKLTPEAIVQGYTKFVWTMAGLGQEYFSNHR